MFKSSTNLSLPGITHGFFTRRGGVSSGLYDSLNCGYGSGDDLDVVAQNRSRVAEAMLSADSDISTAYQIHSPTAVIVEAPFTRETMPQADALVTNTPGVAVGVLTADCAPVLFADSTAGVVAAAHAGWKGAISGVLEDTLAKMVLLGATLENITACIGPCIAQDSYEVGQEFSAHFCATDPDYADFFTPTPEKENHFQFDLPGFVKQRLGKAGVLQVERMAQDTYVLEDEFFSYRRATHRKEPVYGRQVSAIMINQG